MSCPHPFPGAPIPQLLYRLVANSSQLHPSLLQRFASSQLDSIVRDAWEVPHHPFLGATTTPSWLIHHMKAQPASLKMERPIHTLRPPVGSGWGETTEPTLQSLSCLFLPSTASLTLLQISSVSKSLGKSVAQESPPQVLLLENVTYETLWDVILWGSQATECQ